MATKVVILSEDNPDEARLELRKWLTKDKILFIVLGETKLAKETVQRADTLTGGNLDEPHWVIHAAKREDVIEVLDTLDDPYSFVTDWNHPLAIAVSITDTIRDMIRRDGSQPSFSRIDDAFRKAEID